MLIPIGTVKQIPVTVLHVSKEPPVVAEGYVTFFDGQRFEISITDLGTTFAEGDQVLVDFGEGETGRRRTRVESVSDDGIVVNLLGRPRRRDRRFFPRIEGYVNLDFHVYKPNEREKLQDWLTHPHLMEANVVWQKPDAFMDFSATGLRFHHEEALEQGSWLCVRFKLPMLDEETYHCGGEVIRSDPEGEGFSVAVAFVEVSDKAEDALMEYTKRCQDLVLGLDSLQEE